MTVVGEATVIVKGDASKFGPETEKQVAAGLDPVVKKIGSLLGGAFVGAKLFSGLKQGLDELKESTAVAAQTEAAIKSTGSAANVTGEQIGSLAESLSEMSGTDDELIQKGANLLLTFKNVANQVGDGNQIFDEATKAALDLSTAGFGSMESASVLLGKALNDPVKGVTALQRVGVALTDQQKDLVKQLVATGDTLGAQKIILQEVESQVGGSAKAFGETLPGQLAKAQVASDNMKGALIVGLAPAIELGASVLTSFVEGVQELPQPVQTAIGGVAGLAAVFLTVARPLNEGIALLRTLGILHKAAAVDATLHADAELELAGAQTAANATGGSLAATLGKAGIAGAAILAVGGLYAFGRSLNDTTADAEDAAAAIKLPADKAAELLDQLNAISSGPFAGLADSMFGQLVAQGQAGIGVLRTYRQHLVDTGQSTEAVDRALAGAAESQANLNHNMDAGVDPTEEEAKALDAASKAASSFGGFLTDLAGAMDAHYKATVSQTEGTIKYEGSVDSLVDTLRKGSDVLYENAQTLDLTSKKGRENTKAILDTGDAIAGLIEKRFEETHSTKDAIEVGGMYVQNLHDQLIAAGFTEDQVQSYIDTMNLTPDDIATTFSNNAVEQQIVVGKYLASLDEIDPEKQTEIEALINQGAYDGALALINELTRDRNVDVYVNAHGMVNIPDLGPGANREFHGAARGTSNWPGGWGWVGEQGKELAWMPRGSKVIPNDKLGAFADGLGLDELLRTPAMAGAASRGSVPGGDVVSIQVDARGADDPWAVARAVGMDYTERKWRFPRR